MKPERQQLIAEVRRLADAGRTSGEIAAQLGLSRGAVMGIVGRAGIALAGARGPAGVRDSHGPERVARIAELSAKGISADAIAAEIGISPGAVSGICARYGIRRGARPAPRRGLPCDGRDAGRSGCHWPLWANGEAPTHRYCEEPVTGAGKPYCAAHEKRAWARRPTQQEAAA